MSSLLKDLMSIPEETGAEDYVLRLTDSVGARAHDALAEYVVTPEIEAAFDHALGVVADAAISGTSRGAFLAGTFGSGKSHFMSVLHALLRRDPQALGIPALQAVVQQHDAGLHGKKFLPLVFHLLDARSLEQALFDGYLRQIQELHPDATPPALHESDGILEDARGLRATLGDTAFFARLNGQDAAEPADAAGGADPWNDAAWDSVVETAAWDAARFEEALAASAESRLRQDLVAALSATYFTSFTRQADYLPLATGLQVISEHAKGLGYDAVVLFLDELVLWLAFSVRDSEFFRRETQKITLLVESNVGNRAIPLISFIARQMDLQRWFAEAGASGAEQEALDRAFAHQSGRFATVELGSNNLAHVAHQRLLKPRDEDAARTLREAFEDLDRRPGVWDVLLDGVNTSEDHRGAGEEEFRLTYPFSPALISTLRSLASSMQRERTALKVMQQMLVDRRDTLTVDSVIPVGDAYPYVVEGQAPLDSRAQAVFRSAQTLWEEKWLPVIAAEHGVDPAQARGPRTGEDEAALPAGFRTDRRLAWTLLLSAIAPSVPALKDLTASRLASLNHGSVRAPVPGGETTAVVRRLKKWTTQIPELHVSTDSNDPRISLRLADVDYESVVDRARSADTPSHRRDLVRRRLLALMQVPPEHHRPDIADVYRVPVVWRGSTRDVDLVFGNVRDASWLPDEKFDARPGTWRIVIDHPFDEEGHTSAEDMERVDALRHASARQTLVWVPRFLSAEKLKDLRRLTVLDWLFSGVGERWTQHADHLSETDRTTARAILEGQLENLRQSLDHALAQAYGVDTPQAGVLEETGESHRTLTALDLSFPAVTPDGVTFRGVFTSLVEHAFATSYPGHPRFKPEDQPVTVRQLAAVYEHMERAMQQQDRRVSLSGDVSAVRRVANALGAGHAAETHFLFGDDRFPWSQQIARATGGVGDGPVKVGVLRQAIQDTTPAPGLRPEVTDLIILGWALLRQRSWFQHGSPIPAPAPGKLQDGMELRLQPMPSAEDWAAAVRTVQLMFQHSLSPFLTAREMDRAAEEVRARAASSLRIARDLVSALEAVEQKADGRLALDGETRRLATARETVRVLEDWSHLRGKPLVESLARLHKEQRSGAVAASLSHAAEVISSLTHLRWQPFNAAAGLPGDDAQALRDQLRDVLAAEESERAAAAALTQLNDDAYELTLRQITPGVSPPPPVTDPVEPGPEGTETDQRTTNVTRVDVTDAQGVKGALKTIEDFLRQNPGRRVEISWRVAE